MFSNLKNHTIFAHPKGEMAEWSNAAVLKTVEGHTSGGSNPSFSATVIPITFKINVLGIFCFFVTLVSLK